MLTSDIAEKLLTARRGKFRYPVVLAAGCGSPSTLDLKCTFTRINLHGCHLSQTQKDQ